jgi:hypothetical protein
MFPLYELVQDEAADPWLRRIAADALVTFGVLRQERQGVSPYFLWLLGLLLVVASLAAADTLGVWAIFFFGFGLAALGYYAWRQLGKREGLDDVYVGPYGERIRFSGGRDWPADGGSGGEGV